MSVRQVYDDRTESILKQLLERDGNRSCADCANPFPTWTSWTLGVFICFRCAGLHRGLGVHISRVKSISLDQWTPHQVARMAQVGNRKAAQVYEAQLSANFHRPDDSDDLKMFLQMKYVHRIYMSLTIKLDPLLQPDLTYEELEMIMSDTAPKPGGEVMEQPPTTKEEQTLEDASDSADESELLIVFDDNPFVPEKTELPVTPALLPSNEEGEGDGTMPPPNQFFDEKM